MRTRIHVVLAAASVLVLSATGCASNDRVAALEARLEKLEKATGDAGILEEAQERLAAIERRQELARVQLARLEKWQRSVRATKTTEPVKPDGTKPPEPTKVVATADPKEPPVRQGSFFAKDPFARALAADLAAGYETGKFKEDPNPKKPESGGGTDEYGTPPPKDVGKAGAGGEELLNKPLARTRFLASTGETIDLKDYRGKKNVVLVVLRGFDGAVCVACTGQTLAISKKLDSFAEKDAEVFLVYPGKAETVPKFLDAVRDLQGTATSLPVEMLLDVDLSVVKEFKIEGKLAKPTTVVIDKKGDVRFAYVGQTKTDRPSVPQMLEVLARIQGGK